MRVLRSTTTAARTGLRPCRRASLTRAGFIGGSAADARSTSATGQERALANRGECRRIGALRTPRPFLGRGAPAKMAVGFVGGTRGVPLGNARASMKTLAPSGINVHSDFGDL